MHGFKHQDVISGAQLYHPERSAEHPEAQIYLQRDWAKWLHVCKCTLKIRSCWQATLRQQAGPNPMNKLLGASSLTRHYS